MLPINVAYRVTNGAAVLLQPLIVGNRFGNWQALQALFRIYDDGLPPTPDLENIPPRGGRLFSDKTPEGQLIAKLKLSDRVAGRLSFLLSFILSGSNSKFAITLSSSGTTARGMMWSTESSSPLYGPFITLGAIPRLSAWSIWRCGCCWAIPACVCRWCPLTLPWRRRLRSLPGSGSQSRGRCRIG